jgi:LCP family protein required for cell wall assembly
VPRWAADGRLNLLLIGSDAGPDRWSLRTDTIIVLSVEVASGREALFGIPRNLVGVPLPPESAGAFANGRFPGLLNALYVYAMGHPKAFPGGDARGFRAVTGAVQELVGVPLDGVVVVNLAGFVRLVNAIGGLWIDVPERLVDRNYPLEDGSGNIRLDIRRGCQLLDGRMALAYARSRHQDSDYGRMHRQQLVLIALARQVDPIALLPKVSELLDIVKRNLWTTIAREDVQGLAELAADVDTANIRRSVFVPPSYPSHLTAAEIARIGRVVRHAFDAPASNATTQSPASGAACP